MNIPDKVLTLFMEFGYASAILTIISFIVITISSCVFPPSKTQLLDCIYSPRDDYDLSIKYVPAMTTDNECRQLMSSHGVRDPPLVSTHMACTWTQCDAELERGKPALCEVILPEGAGPGDPLYEHEMAHCEGWDD